MNKLTTLITSLIFSVITLYLVTSPQVSECPGSTLNLALWILFSIQVSTLVLVLVPFMGLNLDKAISIFYYLYIVIGMISVQLIFSHNQTTITKTTVYDDPLNPIVTNNQTSIVEASSPQLVTPRDVITISNCLSASPLKYGWIAIHIVLFYLITVFAIAQLGQQICYPRDEDEVEQTKIRKAVKEYLQQHMQEDAENQKTEPLLDQYRRRNGSRIESPNAAARDNNDNDDQR